MCNFGEIHPIQITSRLLVTAHPTSSSQTYHRHNLGDFCEIHPIAITSRLLVTVIVDSTSSGIDLLGRDEVTAVFDGSTSDILLEYLGWDIGGRTNKSSSLLLEEGLRLPWDKLS
ncbi:hypothetical protein IV203_028354 [Nitzschia inconspicua]|uniref:Uncharacterized protein n=1 Tax=Nitzschia inconspicua TaxID=303405 RepID=A0A9K3K867_9STRA|nr:hypothetical protein IV203_028354 [Nitzschia inconspicua]